MMVFTSVKIGVQEIAGLVGMGTVNYFDRFFKKHTGLTPGEYRKKKNQKE